MKWMLLRHWTIDVPPVLSATVLGTTILLLTSCGGEPPEPPEVIRTIKTATVSDRPSGYVRRFSGVLAASSDPGLAFEVGGRVREVDVEAGQPVTAGQMLASIDTASYELELERGLAELERVRAQFADASLDLQTVTALRDEGVATQKAVDSAQNERKRAEAGIRAAQAQVDLSRRDLDHATLRAPFDGMIAERQIEPHQEIAAGATAFVIHGGSGLDVELLVPEIIIDKVAVGQRVEISIAGFNFRGQRFDGIVSQVGATVRQANAFLVRVELEDENPRLRAGLTAEVRFTFQGAAEESSWLLPLTALLPTDDGPLQHVTDREHLVFVYDAETESVRHQTVKMLNVQGDQALIREGLDEGDVVAIAGVSFLRDGQKVKVSSEEIP